MNPTVLAVCTLAAYRLTRLAVHDQITEPARRRLLLRHTCLVGLFGCVWCTGFWATGLVLAVAWALGIIAGGRTLAITWPACATGVGLIGTLDR